MEDYRFYRWIDACFQPASIITIILLPITWGIIFYEMAQDRRRAEQDGLRTAVNLARVIEDHVYRTIKRIDDALVFLGHTYREDETLLDAATWLAKSRLKPSEALRIAVVDARGVLKASSRADAPAVDLSDRDYFRVHAESGRDVLYIGKPVMGRLSGKPSVQLSRRLFRADGSFGGVIIASLDPTFLDEFVRSFDTKRNPMVALAGFDGAVRAAHQPDTTTQAADVASPLVDEQLLSAAHASKVGSYWTTPDTTDVPPRLIAHRAVDDYPLFVAVGLDDSQVFEQALHGQRVYFATGWSITLALAVATLLATSREFKLTAAATALQASHRSLEEINQRFQASLTNMPHGLCMFDREQKLLVCNDRYGEMYRLPKETIRPGTMLDAVLQARVEAGTCPVDNESFEREIRARVTLNEPCQLVVQLRDGRSLAIAHQPLPEGGWVSVHQDITEQKASEAKIAYLAHHDPLTGLYNRASLMEQIEECLARFRRRGEGFALLLLDLDRFKQVNDTHGHPAGDALLQQVALRLTETLRDNDVLARLGGDEFAIIQAPEKEPHAAAQGLAARVIKQLAKPFPIDRSEVTIGTSVGIAIASDATTTAGRLMKMADLALYQTKTRGRNSFAFFDASFEDAANHRSALEGDLRRAVAEGAFELHYQPILDARTHTLCGAEALIRWRHEREGLISPDRFIPVAEECGLIGDIGQWVLRTACIDAAAWPAGTKVAVNLSAVQLRDPVIVDDVVCALVESGLPPERLEIEITETALIDRGIDCLDILKQFKQLGVTIALDDFGTGYSSLSQLTMFPFDKIKIDKSFTFNMTSRPDCAAVIAGVLALARSLDIATTAEGVETSEQFQLLKMSGVSSLQGYLIGRPRPVCDLDFNAMFDNDEAANAA